METAVLHPQDVLAPSQSHPNYRLSMASECASAAALPTPVSVCHGISLNSVGRSSFGATETRGVLSRKESSGLLPLPDHVPLSTHTSLQTASAKFASVRDGGSSRGSLPNSYRKSRFPVLTDELEHAVPLQRRSIFDLVPVSHGRRRPACEDCVVVSARLPQNSSHRCTAAPSGSAVPDEALAHPKIAPMTQKSAKQSNVATCKSASILAKRHGRSRLLDSSASENIQGKMNVSAFSWPSNREGAEKLPCASGLVHLQSRRENGGQQRLAACPALPIHSEENASLVREFVCARLGKVESRNEDVASNWHLRTEDVLDCPDLASDTTGWLSMIDERWAGPSFFNSPPPSALPVPTFTSKLLRTTLTSPEFMNSADCGSSLSIGALVPDAKRTWDVAFATKDLRRLLHLDHASCDG